jgi:hypothetical protein
MVRCEPQQNAWLAWNSNGVKELQPVLSVIVSTRQSALCLSLVPREKVCMLWAPIYPTNVWLIVCFSGLSATVRIEALIL